MTKYEELSAERKALQEVGFYPEWFTTPSYQMFKSKYLHTDQGFKGQVRHLSKTAAKHTTEPELWEERFFTMMWNGWYSNSTPCLSNMGTDRGLPVSCSGSYIPDSIHGFYQNRLETAVLTKQGFGTSAYLGDIRPRGTPISVGGKASGIYPVLKGHVQDMREVSQGGIRRGAWAGSIPLMHGDFYESLEELKNFPDDRNLAWLIYDKDVEALEAGDDETNKRLAAALKVKLLTGKGYFTFPDKANRANPVEYTNHNLKFVSSNLCQEIFLHQDAHHTYTCVLGSMNADKWDEWKDTDAVYWATVYLDCVVSEFLEKAKNIQGMERAVAATEKGRAIGLGLMGLHSLFQRKNIPFESFEASNLNNKIFKRMREEAERATSWLGEELGAPLWCRETGRRNTHLLAVAPTMSTSLIMGGVSQGIEPYIGNAYMQKTSAGVIPRVNPHFLKVARAHGKFDEDLVKDIVSKYGSVQHLSWLTDHERLVFRTAFEINPDRLVDMAAARQRWIDQGQSLNLFFSAGAPEEEILRVHKKAFKSEGIKSLYYLRTQAGIAGSSGECIACEG